MDSSPQPRDEYLVRVEAVIDGQLRGLVPLLDDCRAVGSAVELDFQGRLLQRRLAESLSAAAVPVIVPPPDFDPARLAQSLQEIQAPVIVWFFPRAYDLKEAQFALAASLTLGTARVAIFAHPEVLSKLRHTPTAPAGWPDQQALGRWLGDGLAYLSASDRGRLTPAEARDRLQLFEDLNADAAAGALPEDFTSRVQLATNLNRPWLTHMQGQVDRARHDYGTTLDAHACLPKGQIRSLALVATHVFDGLVDQGRLGEGTPYVRELLGRVFILVDTVNNERAEMDGTGLFVSYLTHAAQRRKEMVPLLLQIAREAVKQCPPDLARRCLEALQAWETGQLGHV